MLAGAVVWCLRELLGQVLVLFPRWAAAWLLSLLVLVYGFKAIKPRVRRHVLQADDAIRSWARGLRYRDLQGVPAERIGLTWLMRFWTNFASAPSLGFLALAVPVWMCQTCFPHSFPGAAGPQQPAAHPPGSHVAHFREVNWWLLPGLCYWGSMLLSFVVKRVFRRLRPPREIGGFGYRLQDPSFPSGHSLTSFCFWGTMAVSVAQSGVPVVVSGVVTLLALVTVACTGLSRVYLGVHFPSDVVGGYVIGLVWSVVCYFALGVLL